MFERIVNTIAALQSFTEAYTAFFGAGNCLAYILDHGLDLVRRHASSRVRKSG